jgi:hypothetical protein
MTEEAAHAVATEASDPADQEKCIKQHAQIAVRKLKYPLCPQATDRYIAEIVIRSTSLSDIK